MDQTEIDRRFDYHPPVDANGGDKTGRHEEMRAEFKEMAEYINAELPESREKSLALTALQEAHMWTHAAIACEKEPQAAAPGGGV